MKKFAVTAFVLCVVLPLIWFIVNVFEGKKPEVKIELPSLFLNRSYEMSASVSDKGTGLRDIRVSIMQHGKEKVLLQKTYDFVGYQGFFIGSQTFEDSFKIPVESWKYDMEDGEAIFRIYVADYSWRSWNKGNSVYQEHKVIIDTKPPEIEVLSKTHNISRGGSSLVIYRLFEEQINSGVQVGGNFFPGRSGMFKDKNIYSAFFALSFLQGPGTEILVKAEDAAGNTASRGFYHYIKDRRFKTDVINISDKFLQRKMPEFDIGANEQLFTSSDNPLLEKFIFINREVRKQNIVDILLPVEKSVNTVLWSGSFVRLPGSANRAGFADHRIYKYKGKEIDRQVHMGIDLASVSTAQILAANKGKVTGTDNIGIFGNSVVLDHGFGLSTVYSHLTTISVQKGDMVNKGDVIGTSGSTGLAGGDHLHYGVAVNTLFVNPIEWWDKKWIENNILSKINNVKKLEK